jgi:hypothetical protein
MGKHPTELYQLVCEDKLRAMAEPGAIDVLMRAFDDILKLFVNWQDNSLKQRPSEYELLDKTLKTIKSFRKKLSRCPPRKPLMQE